MTQSREAIGYQTAKKIACDVGWNGLRITDNPSGLPRTKRNPRLSRSRRKWSHHPASWSHKDHQCDPTKPSSTLLLPQSKINDPPVFPNRLEAIKLVLNWWAYGFVKRATKTSFPITPSPLTHPVSLNSTLIKKRQAAFPSCLQTPIVPRVPSQILSSRTCWEAKC